MNDEDEFAKFLCAAQGCLLDFLQIPGLPGLLNRCLGRTVQSEDGEGNGWPLASPEAFSASYKVTDQNWATGIRNNRQASCRDHRDRESSTCPPATHDIGQAMTANRLRICPKELARHAYLHGWPRLPHLIAFV